MNYQNVLCSSPHCHKLLSQQPTGSSTYSIIKCGHIYHESCFEKVKSDKFCPKCQVVFNPRQCCKIKTQWNESKEDDDALETGADKRNDFYQWIFYDDKTNITAAQFPEFACPLGADETGLTVYVARAFHNDDILPAYICPETRKVFTILENKVNLYPGDIDILDIRNDKAQAVYQWMECTNGIIPSNAIVTGETNSDGKLFTIRSEHMKRMLYGHVDATWDEAQVVYPFEESPGKFEYKVVNTTKYEVLVRKPLTMHAALPENA